MGNPSLHHGLLATSSSAGKSSLFSSLLDASLCLIPVQQHLVPKPAPRRQESSRSRPLSATIVFSRDEIAKLDAFVGTLVAEPEMADPRFFLASVLERKWRPCVVVVSREGRTVGLLYCKERLVAGIGTRIAFGDDALGTMLVTDRQERETIFQYAVTTLLKHMFGVRFLISPDRLSLLKGVQENESVNLSPAKRHSHLGLPRTYDEFLAKIGPQLRRNLRRYRRRSETAGNEFSPDQPFPEFCAAARCLLANGAFTKSGSGRALERSLAMIEAMPSRLLIGLRRRNGEWLSLAGGWYVGDRAIINLQLNDRRFGRDSLSLVLRSYLIETLIKQGVRELVFWVGACGPLSFYCDTPEQRFAYIDAPSMWWRLFRRSFTMLRKFGLATFRKSPLKLVVPFPACTPEEAVLYIR